MGAYQMSTTDKIDETTKEVHLSVEDVLAILQNKDYQRIDAMFQAMQTLAATIAHELRTPLAGIEQGISGVTNFLPILIDAYEQAQKANLPVKRIRAQQQLALKEVLPAIRRQVTRANMFIDMALMNLRDGGINTHEFETFSILDVLEKSIERYPFQPREASLINVDYGQDFEFEGIEIYTIHVFYNLIKNALFFIHAQNRGEVFIHTEITGQWNKLYFKDTSKGIPEEVLPHIFGRFFSQRDSGTGVGLAFCRMVMESYNGYISCRSQEGEFTEFTLLFPKGKRITE